VRVIEVAHVEGRVFPIITMDGEPLRQSVTTTQYLNEPTIILLGGHRVTEPTRVVKNGVIIAQDNAGTESG
jgi:hypothetical protein